MAKNTPVVVGGIAVGVIFFLLLPGWLKLLAIVAIIGIPAAGYLMLDPSQRRRLREQRRRRRIGP
ncbi:hypothetical protein [Phytoactinopolyspora halotolerans]|uniref:Uncharacterized protein n=1 Tax=Phytoactinopolyspora halotolerans TaxID=1981512 RepID=A0A6L9S2H9_9ACTN|nr:hypothetical protein [Phytoactinopolyspora halotolerans]NED99272.1 hypothetical protein [Phytoactinopolyspora halotolerans]